MGRSEYYFKPDILKYLYSNFYIHLTMKVVVLASLCKDSDPSIA